MQHTYLRYECADAFSLTASAGSTPSMPRSSSILAFLGGGGPSPPSDGDGNDNGDANYPLLSLAGSQLIGYDLRRGGPSLKIGHREVVSGGVGTGRALNSGHVVCLDVSARENERVEDAKVATGWMDGSVRVFSIEPKVMAGFASSSSGGSDDPARNGLAHSLLFGDGASSLGNANEEFACREPLVLNGHGFSPVQMVAFDKIGGGAGRLASAGADGVVILWDVIAETGLFRLLGHRGPVTGITFIRPSDASDMDGLVTSGSDGLVKVWDLNGQCCVQTLTGHRGSVGCLDCSILRPPGGGGVEGGGREARWRLVTGCADGQVRVWSVKDATLESDPKETLKETNDSSEETAAGDDPPTEDEVFRYVGSLRTPATVNMTPSNNEGVASVHFHPRGRYVGVCRNNDRTIEIYAARSEAEAQKKRRRRLRRRREKRSLAVASASERGAVRKRGMLDDPESEDEEGGVGDRPSPQSVAPEALQAMDEFEFRGIICASHKIRGFVFAPFCERGGGVRVAMATAANALEVHSLPRPPRGTPGVPMTADRVSTLDMYGHPTGIRSVSLSSEDATACTVSKGVVKVWNVNRRSCLRSLAAVEPGGSGESRSGGAPCYCLCSAFLPGDTHLVLGTREGSLIVIDVASGDIVHAMGDAHDGAIWSLDLRPPFLGVGETSLVTGSADKLVKYWTLEGREDSPHPALEHARTLQMSDDIMCVRFSHSANPEKRLLFVASLDSTIKVFFDDSLKFFLSLYGHKLPVLAFDSSSDDTILASGGADKSIKIWGLDFGDTHRTLYGHEDSITDLRFVKRTHYFFTCSKDKTVRYWDGDRFQQILLLRGHASEVNCLAVSSNGAFVLSGGMDRQVRVWERTKDIVFPDEERERELEEMFDRVDGSRREENTADTLAKARKDGKEGLDADEEEDEKPQSEAAVKQSVLSVSSGDRIMEAIEMADNESKEIASFRKLQDERGGDDKRASNPMLFGMDPPSYVLWILRSVKSVNLEQSLLILPLNYVERLMHYLIVNLQRNKGVELCAKISVFLIRSHQSQIVRSPSMIAPLRELQYLVRKRTTEIRDMVGFNLAAMRMVAQIADEKKSERLNHEEKSMKDIWGELGKIS